MLMLGVRCSVFVSVTRDYNSHASSTGSLSSWGRKEVRSEIGLNILIRIVHESSDRTVY